MSGIGAVFQSTISSITAEVADIPGAIVSGLESILVGIPIAEITAFQAALKVAEDDLAAGKTIGVAYADAYSSIYNAEGVIVRQLLINLLSVFISVPPPVVPIAK